MSNNSLKNKSFYASKSDGWFGSREVEVYKRRDVDIVILDLENQIYELQEELKLREFIECPCCNSEMQWINKREYGCMNENCTSIARVI